MAKYEDGRQVLIDFQIAASDATVIFMADDHRQTLKLICIFL